VSYQAVGSSFFWALPLHQLGLAFSGSSDGPRLLDNFEAELVATAAAAAAAAAAPRV
jgi:hypothetical protein